MKGLNSINNLIKYINEEKLGDYLLDEKLSKHTSLKIGGIANILFYPKDIEGLRKVLKFIREHNIEYYIIGNGTNLLINERYFKAVFINLKNIKIVNKLNKNKFFISKI